jgi:hypothetical protein
MDATMREFWRRPPTAEQAAWTDSGRVPTLIAAGIIFAPLALPESAAATWAALSNLGYGAANAYLSNPAAWNAFIGGALPGAGGLYTTWPGFFGNLTGQLVVDPLTTR